MDNDGYFKEDAKEGLPSNESKIEATFMTHLLLNYIYTMDYPFTTQILIKTRTWPIYLFNP